VNQDPASPATPGPHDAIELDQAPAAVRPLGHAAPRQASWRPPEPPPTSWLQDNLGRVILYACLGAVAGGAWVWWTRPVVVPDLVLKDTAGQTAALSALHQDKPRLVLVFLVKGDRLSTYALTALKDLPPAKTETMAFLGLLMGPQAEAEAYAKDNAAPFPIYGLTDVQDPFAVQELVKKVGVSTMVMTGVYGGTVVVLDRRNRVVLKLQKEEIQDLGSRL